MQSKKWYTTNYFWTPRRKVKFNYIDWWWLGVAASIAVTTAGVVYLANQNQHPV